MTLPINEIICGDCLDVMPIMPDKSIDMILCDLPYGTTCCSWDSIIPLDRLWKQYERIIKDNGAIVLTAQTPFDKVLGMSNIKLLRYEWIWEKEQGTGSMNANKMPLKKHENILVFYKYLPTYNPEMKQGTPYQVKRKRVNSEVYGKTGTRNNYIAKNNGHRWPTSIIQFQRKVTSRIHPTQKPVALFEYLIRTYTNPGDLVLDNCIGSGTTAIAAYNTGRNFIGIEKEKRYVDAARKRYADHTAQLRLDITI
jgi:site-specific DNA-methyltransferase (adenine-specific)